MIETLQSHYGFTVMPFTAAIPVTGLFGSAAHKEAVARLRWLISARVCQDNGVTSSSVVTCVPR